MRLGTWISDNGASMTLHQKIAQQDQRVAEYEEMMLAAFDAMGEVCWRKHAVMVITEAMQLRQAFPENDSCTIRALLVGYAMERFNRLLAERQLAHAEGR